MMRYGVLYYRFMQHLFHLFRLYQYSPARQRVLCASPGWHLIEEVIFQAHDAGDLQVILGLYQCAYQRVQGPRVDSYVRQASGTVIEVPFPLSTGVLIHA